MYHSRWKALTSVLLSAVMLSACTLGGSEGESSQKALGKEEQVTIKVMYDYDESEFYQEYGALFTSKFPNIDVEVVSKQSLDSSGADPEDSVYQWIEEQNPDVLMLSMDQYEKLAREGKLYDLESVIKQDKFDLEGIHPAILKLLRDRGEGKLYGLSPTFNSQALFYNIDLFQQYGVEPPTDSMSWDEVLSLAKRFPTNGNDDDRVYGFGLQNYSTYSDLAITIGLANELQVLNADESNVTLDTDGWKSVFQMVADAVSSHSILLPNQQNAVMGVQDYYTHDPFISGKVAMKIGNSFEAENLNQATKMIGKEKMPHWSMVTAPVDPNNRNQSNYINISNVIAVNAHAASPNQRAAWEFVKYVNSEEFARIKSKSPNSGELLSWTSYLSDVDGVSKEPFYKLVPGANSIYPSDTASEYFSGLFMPILQEELQEVIDNKKTLDEAMDKMQIRAQEALEQAKK